MTSTAAGDTGASFGWMNRKLIASGQTLEHFNPFGGEDRLWLGPEGGQFSIYFKPGDPFDLAHWFVPKALDTLPFKVTQSSKTAVMLESRFSLTNHSGVTFQVALTRTVHVLDRQPAWQELGLAENKALALVAFESRNTLANAGERPWAKNTGLLSIWILGMYNPSSGATIVIPIRPGPEADLGRAVTADYFGKIPPDRLHITDRAVFLRGDGQYRSKVGVNPRRSLRTLGSYDSVRHVLTIVRFDQPQGAADYVNSLWKIQSDPFAGDAANAYNDGPPAAGAAPMGPFYELESSSPAAALVPGAHLTHAHRTFHIAGPAGDLDGVARAVLGVSLADIVGAFPARDSN